MKHLVHLLGKNACSMPSIKHRILPSLTLQRSQRLKSTATATTPFQLPKATWSVAELELSKQHEPVSEEELRKLAKRALLDMDQQDDSTRQQLRQDLGNMMHMIEQVQSFQFEGTLSDVDIYDKPRGVTSAPLRDDTSTTNSTAYQQDEEKEVVAKKVWDSFLRPNTTKVGAHEYFSIETKREGKKA